VSGAVPLVGDDLALVLPFVQAGVLDAADVYVASLIARTVPGVESEVLLASALAARGVRLGHVCVVLADLARSVVVEEANAGSTDLLGWPDPERWGRLLSESPAVRRPAEAEGDVVLPLVWDGARLYLERYWRFEERVAKDLLRRAADTSSPAGAADELGAILRRLFDPNAGTERGEVEPRQLEAVAAAFTSRITVIAGGPGTGKTLTVSRLLGAAYELARDQRRQLSVALAAPTGKAAARMEAEVQKSAILGEFAEVSESMSTTRARTLHRLLGIGTTGRPRFDRFNRLPHDLVIVDETSMVSLPLMARLLDAVRADATLVLVGDPFQLASVEAGAVLGEIVGPAATGPAAGPLAGRVVVLEHSHRFAPGSEIASLAEAVRKGDDEGAVRILRSPRSGELVFVEAEEGDEERLAELREEAADNAVDVIGAALAGDAQAGLALASELKVLCATRFGPLGVSGWTSSIETLAKRRLPNAGVGGRRYVGRPIIVTRNDYLNNVFNGDVGLVVWSERGPVVGFPDASGGIRTRSLSQLGAIDTWWATTIHKSQGSEFERVIVSLPPAPSPILTRELLYTAVTRAKKQVTLVASEAAVRAAVTHPVARASGLLSKLWPGVRDLGADDSSKRRPRPPRTEQLSFDV
jgi:exodeoxyribonuclease V alpha subunit